MVVLAAALPGACAPLPQDCERPEVFCAGLVTAFGTTSEGINREAWLALQDARTTGIVHRIDRIETVDGRDRAANIRFFGDAGYDVVVTVGTSISEETYAAALQYPKSSFIAVDQPQDRKLENLVGLVFHEERSGFLAGALAGLMTQTGRVAAVCESRYVDAVRRYCDGFAAGAKYTNPDALLGLEYRDGSTENLFHDLEWGRRTALDQLDQGADIVFAAGGTTADAALQAAASKDALVIGTETDAYFRLADIRAFLVTSAVDDVRSGVLTLIHLAQKRTLPQGDFAGTVGLAPFHDLESGVPGSARARLQEVERALEAGTLLIGVPWKGP